MALSLGARLGPYEILSPLGAGGMGEVYRARDTKLNRDVAIKVLPDLFASDAERLARFTREAQTLASLNHPNIAHIHGLEESNGVRALVMEFVEGEDLSQRIARGPIPIGEALPIAKQIADALEAAHEQGIIHRDLKPANIKVRSDGTVKVLDFGLAKALDPASGSRPQAQGGLTQSPTITSPAMTQAGMILGTAAYMSPEQARGRAADKRADIWAFGCVLYEMLTGQRAFDGETISDVLAKVIEREPDWNALPATSPRLRELLRRCVKKDPKARLRDIGDARVQIEELLSGRPEAVAVIVTAPEAPRWRLAAVIVLAALVSAGGAAAFVWRYKPASPRPVARLSIPLPEGQRFQITIGRQLLAISRDGTALVYVANRRLYLRALADTVATPITAVSPQQLHSPAFSPDGRFVMFYSGTDAGGTLKKVATSGGAEIPLCATGAPFGVSWGDSGIVFGERRGVMRVSADGGEPELLVAAKDGEALYGPRVLPDGRSVLFTIAATTGGPDRWDKGRIVVQSLATGERTTLIEGGGSDARYLPTGHLVYALGGVLFAVPFDAQRFVLTGTPVRVLEGVFRQSRANGPAAAEFSVSDTGSLVYVRGSVSIDVAMDLMWQDREGTLHPFGLPPNAYSTPRLSPDGHRVAFGLEDGAGANIWISDVTNSRAARRLTTVGANRFPEWASDNEHVAFQSDREGDLAIFWQKADFTEAAKRLTTPVAGTEHVPYSWAPDGAHFLYGVLNGTRASLWVHDSKEQKEEPFGKVESSFPPNAVFAPDGRSVAYVSGEKLNNVFVQPFPATGTPYPVSHPDSGSPTTEANPFWSHDGKELFYAPGPADHVGVKVTTAPGFAVVGNPVQVPSGRWHTSGPGTPRDYDISRNGKQFLIVASVGTGPVPDQIQVVLNWTEELKRLVPTR